MITQENQTGKKTWGGFNLAILKVNKSTIENLSLHNSDLDH